MLSYRHAFHAGNFADVMKHIVLTASLKHLTRKSTAVCYLDTHAGAGGYDLHSEQAKKTGESNLGVAKIWQAHDAPDTITNYLELLHRLNPTGELGRYPGSPWFAAQLLRPQDRVVLCELHNNDFALLEKTFANDGRVYCHAADGYVFSKGIVPPIERRGLIFMDPSYELRDEYDTAFATIARLHRQFSTGTYALWYPILDESRGTSLRLQFESSQIRDVLHLALRVADQKSFPGMYGSGMIVVNPPWTLRAAMETALPWLVTQLGINDRAGFQVEQWVAE
jgi:23S rRNA (adenine2030-N6)-methyltransferase